MDESELIRQAVESALAAHAADTWDWAQNVTWGVQLVFAAALAAYAKWQQRVYASLQAQLQVLTWLKQDHQTATAVRTDMLPVLDTLVAGDEKQHQLNRWIVKAITEVLKEQGRTDADVLQLGPKPGD